MPDDRQTIIRLWRHTAIDIATGCWTWTGPLNRSGYGKIIVARKTQQVHRLAAKLLGRPFDDDLTLDHVCRNRACWNPAHLDPCTLVDNILRGEGPTAINARKTHCINGHELTSDNIRHRAGQRSHHRECLTCQRERDRRPRQRRSAA